MRCDELEKYQIIALKVRSHRDDCDDRDLSDDLRGKWLSETCRLTRLENIFELSRRRKHRRTECEFGRRKCHRERSRRRDSRARLKADLRKYDDGPCFQGAVNGDRRSLRWLRCREKRINRVSTLDRSFCRGCRNWSELCANHRRRRRSVWTENGQKLDSATARSDECIRSDDVLVGLEFRKYTFNTRP